MNNCKFCGKQLSISSIQKKIQRCRECYYKSRRTGRNFPNCVDCGKKLHTYHNQRCKTCFYLHRVQTGEFKGKNCSNYKDGISLIQHYCLDCKKEITRGSKLGRCSSCSKKLENHWNWQGGLSFEEYSSEFDNVLKEQVRFRDRYKCQVCGCSQLENVQQLDCHHIDYDKEHNVLENLISLCNRCHPKTNYNRDFWYAYFTELIKGDEYESVSSNTRKHKN